MSILVNIEDLLSGAVVEGSVCAFSDQDTDLDKSLVTLTCSRILICKSSI
jgi:hypothetical protein